MSERTPLSAGLYVVSTPIGAARDITLRALDVLRDADAIAAEDTRVTRKLLAIHGIPLRDRPLIPYHDHNGAAQRPKILAMIAAGKAVAQVSDAGTPLVADPGFSLARAVADAGLAVHPVPGPSSVLAALVVSGLPSDRFLFAGFVPPTEAGREKFFAEVRNVPATLVVFETGKRLLRSISCAGRILGGSRPAAICRELTKKFEESRRGTLDSLAQDLADGAPKGEIVLLIGRGQTLAGAGERDAALREAMKTMTVKDAARHVARALDLPKREVYQAALALSSEA